jgi:hypothetical protein
MIRVLPQCLTCAHFRSQLDHGPDAPEQACDAYPDRIPDPIWWNQVDHRQPYDGDQGITWEPLDGAEYPEWVLDEPSNEPPVDDAAARSRTLALLGVTRAAGHDITPGHDELHHYWTKGPGLAKWVTSPHQFETLRDLLLQFPFFQEDPERANKAANDWVHEATGLWPGSDAHRVAEGGKPRGHRIGPG